MRSAALAGLALLAGCEGGADKAAQSGENPPGATSAVEEIAAASAAPVATAASAPAPDQALGPVATPIRPAQSPPRRFQALGTEPFWSFDVLEGQLRYTSPEQPTKVTIKAQMTAIGKHGDGGLMWEGRMDGKPVILTIREGRCSDGMSDTVYPYTASFTWGERTEQGCARPK
ncbi:MAG: COG3650 family protein [Novosphingobium sp.]